MELTVAICTYRRFDWLKKCLSSLGNQTLSNQEFKITVVDNSLIPDESRIFKESLKENNNIDYIITEKAGLSYARNIALKECRSSVIAYLDDDAIVDADWAEQVISAFDRYPSAGAIGGKVNPIWEIDKPDWIKGSLLYNLAILDWGDKDFLLNSSNKWLVGANIAYRTEALRKIGGFDQSLGRKANSLFAHEELATNTLMNLYGYDVVYIPSMCVNHLIQKERITKHWFFKNSLFDGASRFIYEHDVNNVNLDEIAKNLEDEFDKLNEEYLKVPDDTEKIVEISRIFNSIGRNICKQTLINCLQKTHDYYFENIVTVIYVVTPCLNSYETIDQTILSVLSQAGDFSIRYHIQDGGSKDGTLKKLALWNDLINRGVIPLQCRNIVFTYESCSDDGMYDAIAKSIKKMSIPPNSFMTWINSDDIFMPGAFSLISRISFLFPKEYVSWITGAKATLHNNQITNYFYVALPTEAIKAGICDGVHWAFLQQEGTFFRKWLWDIVEGEGAITNFKYAGDWNLWRLFAQKTDLAQVEWPLGVFRNRKGQLSTEYFKEYTIEIDETISRKNRSQSLKSLTEKKILKQRIISLFDSGSNYELIEKGAVGQAYYYYKEFFHTWPFEDLLKEDDSTEKKLFIASESSVVLNKKQITLNNTKCIEKNSQKDNSEKTKIYSKAEDSSINIKSTSCIINKINMPKVDKFREINKEYIKEKDRKNIFIVTPCVNVEKTIDQTIKSVVFQKGDFTINYHIKDGGSTDNTIKKLMKWKKFITENRFKMPCREVIFSWSSEKDKGVYDAIIKGFDIFTIDSEEYMTWINGDDLLLTGALSTVTKISKSYPEIKWLGSIIHTIDMSGKVLLNMQNPTPTSIIKEGLCDGSDEHWKYLQQEGMFFTKSLWFKSKHVLKNFKYAGDWALWREYAKYEKYYQYEKALGAFRRREGQLSISSINEYKEEIDKALPLEKRKDAFKKIYYNREEMQADIIKISSNGSIVLEKIDIR